MRRFIGQLPTRASMSKIPVASMVLLLGLDRFMSEARAITHTIGNAVGTVAIARWVGSVDCERLAQVHGGQSDPEDLRGRYEGSNATNPGQPLSAARPSA